MSKRILLRLHDMASGASLCAGALLLGGCSTWHLFVTIKPDARSNQGRPLQVLVRSVPIPAFRSEPYSVLSRLVTQPDKSVLRIVTIEPGAKRRLYIGAPSAEPLAIYFLYGAPTANWKMLLPPPLPWSVTVPLGSSGVDAEAVRECRFLRGVP